ncbi:unnamed protein product [Bemisia tabaci]|uniref:Uncharacterized protein n=2 Tax=Bemisia tabaci TaxID=7038 RepID=A0A9P0F503_BEMTA|nr:unnamed protein product [Bemisia tabaci]
MLFLVFSGHYGQRQRFNTSYVKKIVKFSLLLMFLSVLSRSLSDARRLKMPKPSSKNAKKSEASEPKESSTADAIAENKNGNIVLSIQAKPGAKQNNIVDISSEGIGVQINAPPVEGEANTELVKFLSKVLGIRKSDLNLDKGSRSRKKVIVIEKSAISIDEVRKKINEEIARN